MVKVVINTNADGSNPVASIVDDVNNITINLSEPLPNFAVWSTGSSLMGQVGFPLVINGFAPVAVNQNVGGASSAQGVILTANADGSNANVTLVGQDGSQTDVGADVSGFSGWNDDSGYLGIEFAFPDTVDPYTGNVITP